MTCKECGAPESRVVDTRRATAPNGRELPERIRRRRECAGCGARWTTVEVHDGEWGDGMRTRVVSDEAIAFVDECLTVLGARLRYYPPSSREAAAILHQEFPDITAEDLRKALNVSESWAGELHRGLRVNGTDEARP